MNPQQFDEFMAFGDKIRADQEQRTKRMKEEKQQEEEMQRIREHNQMILETRSYYPFLNHDFVYFLKEVDGNKVKIGWSNSVHTRVYDVSKDLFSNNGLVIGLFRGNAALEARCHEIFEDERVVGTREIFYHSDHMKTFLQNVMSDEEKELVGTLNEYMGRCVVGWGGRT